MSICVICGKEFTPPNKYYKRKTCSDECYRKYRSIVERGTAKGAKIRYLKTCVVCGKEFYTKTASIKTCSRECFKKLKAELQTGISNKWSPEARAKMVKRWEDNYSSYAEHGRNGNKIMMKNPKNQKGPQNQRSKEWILENPEGDVITVINLRHWVRENIQEYFGMEPTGKNVQRIYSFFSRMKRNIVFGREEHWRNNKIYEGWKLLDYSNEPKPVEIDDVETQQ